MQLWIAQQKSGSTLPIIEIKNDCEKGKLLIKKCKQILGRVTP